MNADITRHTIVCAISTPDSAHWVLARAAEEARHHPGTMLEILQVLEPRRRRRRPSAEQLDQAVEQLESLVREVLADLEPVLGDTEATCRLRVRAGHPAEEIALLAGEVAADAIVVGARSSRSHDVPGELLELAECRLEVVRPKEYEPIEAEPEDRAEREDDDLPLSSVLRPGSFISSRPTTFG